MDFGVNLYTQHLGPAPCDVNPGVYVTNGHFGGGVFRNSECNVGAWGAWTPQTNTLAIGPVQAKAGAMVGAVLGYRLSFVLPLVAPSAAVRFPGLPWVRATYLPTFGVKNAVDGVHFSVEYPF